MNHLRRVPIKPFGFIPGDLNARRYNDRTSPEETDEMGLGTIRRGIPVYRVIQNYVYNISICQHRDYQLVFTSSVAPKLILSYVTRLLTL